MRKMLISAFCINESLVHPSMHGDTEKALYMQSSSANAVSKRNMTMLNIPCVPSHLQRLPSGTSSLECNKYHTRCCIIQRTKKNKFTGRMPRQSVARKQTGTSRQGWRPKQAVTSNVHNIPVHLKLLIGTAQGLQTQWSLYQG
jgi:hypothetical protein